MKAESTQWAWTGQLIKGPCGTSCMAVLEIQTIYVFLPRENATQTPLANLIRPRDRERASNRVSKSKQASKSVVMNVLDKAI